MHCRGVPLPLPLVAPAQWDIYFGIFFCGRKRIKALQDTLQVVSTTSVSGDASLLLQVKPFQLTPRV